MNHSTPLVSLVVVTYNSAALLPAFFAALDATTYRQHDITVVDNASQDGTLAWLAANRPQVQVLANSENRGFGAACNQGARVAAGDMLVFMNPDVIVTPDWLTTLLANMAAAASGAGIICPVPRDIRQLRAGAVATTGKVEAVAAVPGCAMLVPRPVWQALGGFDERMFLYWEDVDLCWRAWLGGWRVLADGTALVFHERGGSGGGGRWDAERTKNGIYTTLKLMRWRRALPFLLAEITKTLAKMMLGRGRGLLGAWLWNGRMLRQTLALRREHRRMRRGDPAMLEQMIATQQRQLRALRRREAAQQRNIA